MHAQTSYINLALFFNWVLYFTDFNLCSFNLNVSVFNVTKQRDLWRTAFRSYICRVCIMEVAETNRKLALETAGEQVFF